MAPIGLYYPFIHFKDDEWLKLSALYWEKMARIVPSSYRRGRDGAALERDSPVTRELASELDFIVNISPREVTYPVFELFAELLKRHAEALRGRYDVRKSAEWPVDRATTLYAPLRDPHLAYVNSEKLRPELVAALAEESLAAPPHNEGDEFWVGMHSDLASVYMSALAEEIANVNGLRPATDDTLDHVAACGWSLPRLAATLLKQPGLAAEAGAADEAEPDGALDSELSATLALLCVERVVPVDVRTLPVTKIAEIRSRFGPELFRFQEFVDQVAQELPQFGEGADPAAVRAHLDAAYKRDVQPHVDELRDHLRGVGVETAVAAASTSFPIPTVVGMLGLASPITAGAAVVLGLVPVVRAKRRQAHEAYAKSPAAYLYRLEQDLTSRTLLNEVANRAQSFLVGV